MSLTSRIACVALLLLLTPVLAFAQGKPPGKGADSCALVTKAEIEQGLGLKLEDGKKDPKMQNAGVLSSCDYASSDGGTVGILIRQNETKWVPGTEKAAFEKQGMKLTYIKGLGTTAGFIDMMGMGTGVVVFRGDYDYLQVSTMMTKVPNAKLEALARLVLERWK